jgi:hypothetical protein
VGAGPARLRLAVSVTTPDWLTAAFVQSVDVFGRVETGTDEYGNPLYATTAIATVMGLLQPAAQADIQMGRASLGAYTLFLPAELAGQIDEFSTYTVDGESFEADGEPSLQRQLFAPGVHHVEQAVTRSTA